MVRKRVLSWLLASTVLATGAQAADLLTPTPAVPAFTWTGFYAGVNAGAGFDYSTRNGYTYTDPLELPANRTTALGFSNPGSNALVGLELGYNWQFNQIVVGYASDFNWALSGARSNFFARRNCELTACVAGPDGFDHFLESGNNQLNFGTARLKLGYAWGQALLYVTGGLAFDPSGGAVISDYRLQNTATPLGTYNGVRPDATYADNSSSAWGYAIGGGLAYAITPNFSIKGEYLYVNMRADTSGTLVASTPNFGTVTSGNRTDSFSVVRLGLDYKFFAF